MDKKISVVINTLNEEKNIERALNSVVWADEILVCDMHSDDNTAVIAKKKGAKIIFHKRTGFVEPARNFAISKAANEWILILDADEEVPDSLKSKLTEITAHNGVTTFVEVPRKNIMFNKWVKASMWWPDYNIRFFQKGAVEWSNKIHRPPKTTGQGIKLSAEERYAIIHHHYDTITQFLERMNRYTTVQAKELKEQGYTFAWQDLIKQPLSEFLSRYFAHRGFDDGLHGLTLSFLQAFSHLVMYIKVWELEGFKEQTIKVEDVNSETKLASKEIAYWLKYGNLSKNPLKRFVQRAKNKLM